jgi:predicted lipoprotein
MIPEIELILIAAAPCLTAIIAVICAVFSGIKQIKEISALISKTVNVEATEKKLLEIEEKNRAQINVLMNENKDLKALLNKLLTKMTGVYHGTSENETVSKS